MNTEQLKLLPKQSASPLAALFLAVATISCCLPFPFLGAIGLAGFAAYAQTYSAWFMAAAFLALSVGFYQLYGSRRRQCRTRSGLVVFWLSAVLVALVIFFPQVIASIAAQLS